MSIIEGIWSNASSIVVLLIHKYKETWFFRDAVKTLLAWNPNQICPCGVLHGRERVCSTVILKVAENKPKKLFLAIVVQKERCRKAANEILLNPELRSQYHSVKQQRRREREKKWENSVCDNCNTGVSCTDFECNPNRCI